MTWLACLILLKIAYLLMCRALSLAVLVFCDDLAKNAAPLVLQPSESFGASPASSRNS